PLPLPDVIKEAPASEPSAPAPASGRPSEPGPASASDQRAEALRQARQEEIQRARGAGLFIGTDEVAVVATQPASPPRRDDGNAGSAGAAAAPDSNRLSDPNMQERKNDFLSRVGVSSAEYLEKAVSLPRSPFEVKAGTVIPTVLISGIN